MGLFGNLFGGKKYTCEKCGKKFPLSEGRFILRNKDRFCCNNCCGEAIKKSKTNEESEVCEFC